MRASHVSPLQSADGSSAAQANPAQRHAVLHRSTPFSAVGQSHQGSVCEQGKCIGTRHLEKRKQSHRCVLSNQQDSVTVWSGKQVTVYELSGTAFNIIGNTFKLMSDWPNSCNEAWLSVTNFPPFVNFSCHATGSFPCDSQIVAVHSENLYTVEPNRVQIRTPQVGFPLKSQYFLTWIHTRMFVTISLGHLFLFRVLSSSCWPSPKQKAILYFSVCVSLTLWLAQTLHTSVCLTSPEGMLIRKVLLSLLLLCVCVPV